MPWGVVVAAASTYGAQEQRKQQDEFAAYREYGEASAARLRGLLGKQKRISSNCVNCGAPEEPEELNACSYCGTKK